MQEKLALLAKENITLDLLLEPKPKNVQLPLKPICENTITGSSAQSERERLARNVQLKMNWENRCQKQMELGIMCGDKPWTQADRKTVLMLYLSLGTEGRRIICSRNPHLKMDTMTTVELWNITESTFIRQRNITFNRYMLLTTKQSKGESMEHFFGKLKELSENCDLGDQEDTLIRDLFIANTQDPEIQRELHRETLETPQALRLAINMELGQRYQLQFSNTQPSIEETTTNRSVNAIQNTDPQCASDYDSSDDNMVASIASNTIQIEPKNTTLQIGNTQVGLLIYSGSVCSILNESLATEVVNNSTLARWLTTAPTQELKTFAKNQ